MKHVIYLFTLFVKSTTFAFGGGYAMIPVLQDALVIKDALLTQAEFLEGLAICNMLSGPMTVNLGLYLGYSVFGWTGALVAAFSILSVVFLWSSLAVKAFDLLQNKPLVNVIFRGMRDGVVVVMFMAMFNMLDATILRNVPAIIIGVISFAVSAFTRINPALVILSAGVLGLLFRFSG